MPRLEISVLGSFQVILDGKPVTGFESNKVRALLAYLAEESARPQRRELLADLLWPDWPQQSAMRNLSSALADLRKNIADREADPPFLLISRDSLQFNRLSAIRVDHWGLEQEMKKLGSRQPNPSPIAELESITLSRTAPLGRSARSWTSPTSSSPTSPPSRSRSTARASAFTTRRPSTSAAASPEG